MRDIKYMIHFSRHQAIIAMAIFWSSICQAQHNIRPQAQLNGKITGIKLGISDSITIEFSPGYIFFETTKYREQVSSDGTFKFNLPPIKNPCELVLSMKGYNKIIVINPYVEPGEQINVEVDLSGKDPEASYNGGRNLKYQCIDSLNSILENMYAQIAANSKDFRKAPDVNLHYKNYYNFRLKTYKQILQVLNQNQSKIGPGITSYIAATYQFQILGQVFLQFKYDYNRAGTDLLRQRVAENYRLYRKVDVHSDLEEKSKNPKFISMLLDRTKSDLFFENMGKGVTLKAYYDRLKADYQGEALDKVLAQFLYDPNTTSDIKDYRAEDLDYCILDAIRTTNDPYLKQKAYEKGNLSKGSDVYDFILTDTAGISISKKDILGKVTLMDFWFTGCAGCAAFYRMFESEVLPILKHEPNFRVASVNINSNRQTWLKGIESGKYTNSHHLNLTTSGPDHPMLKHYNVLGFPFILLIDSNGKIFTKIDGALSSAEILEQIKAALSVKADI